MTEAATPRRSPEAVLGECLDRLTAAADETMLTAAVAAAAAAVTELAHRAPEGMPMLLARLRDPAGSSAQRVAVVRLLGLIPSELSVEPLVQALSDSDRLVQWQAGESLRALSAWAVPALRESLGHYNPELRKIAAFALGVIGPAARAAVPELTEMANDARPSLRQHARLALHAIVGDEWTV